MGAGCAMMRVLRWMQIFNEHPVSYWTCCNKQSMLLGFNESFKSYVQQSLLHEGCQCNMGKNLLSHELGVINIQCIKCRLCSIERPPFHIVTMQIQIAAWIRQAIATSKCYESKRTLCFGKRSHLKIWTTCNAFWKFLTEYRETNTAHEANVNALFMTEAWCPKVHCGWLWKSHWLACMISRWIPILQHNKRQIRV